MGIDRRGFLAGMLALGAAPAIVRAGSLMSINQSRWTMNDEYRLMLPVALPTGRHGLIAPTEYVFTLDDQFDVQGVSVRRIWWGDTLIFNG